MVEPSPGVDLVRVDRADQIEICEAFWQEYGDWAVAEYHARYGLVTQPDHEGIRAEMPVLLGERGRLYLAQLDGGAVGTGALKPIDRGSVELKRMYVHPPARRRGISRMLLSRLIGDAAELGYTRVRLDTLDFMTEAQALYRSVGFVDGPPYERSETVRAGVVEHTVYMELFLTKPWAIRSRECG